jgi:hypothetical protein
MMRRTAAPYSVDSHSAPVTAKVLQDERDRRPPTRCFSVETPPLAIVTVRCRWRPATCELLAMGLAIAAANDSYRADKYEPSIVVSGVLGLVLLLINLLTRYSVIKIASAADAIEFRVSRVGKAKVLDFVNALELAKRTDMHYANQRSSLVEGEAGSAGKTD